MSFAFYIDNLFKVGVLANESSRMNLTRLASFDCYIGSHELVNIQTVLYIVCIYVHGIHEEKTVILIYIARRFLQLN